MKTKKRLFVAAPLLAIVAALFIMTGCGSGINLLPEPFTRERADGKIPVKIELIRQQVQRELSGIPEGEAEVARWQAIEADYHSCRLSSKKAANAAEEVFADCMAKLGYVYMYRIDAEQLHNDIAFEVEKEHEKQEKIRRQKALNDALVAAVRNGDSAEEARLILEGANSKVAEKERKAIAAEKKWQEEQEQLRLQKKLNDALVAAVRSGNTKEEARLIAEGANPQVAEKERILIAIEQEKKAKLLAAERKWREELAHALQQKELTDVLIDTLRSRPVNIFKVKRLIDAGVDVNDKGIFNLYPPLYHALFQDNIEVLHVLIKAGADVNAKNYQGNTLLHDAVMFSPNPTETVPTLIKVGADINAKDNKGNTPLHAAIYLHKTSNRTEAISALIKAGANVNAKTNFGGTPLSIAQFLIGRHSDIVRILKQAGAKRR